MDISIRFGALLLMLAAVHGDVYVGDENSFSLSQLWKRTKGETEKLHDEKTKTVKKDPALVRLTIDAARVAGLDDDEDIDYLEFLGEAAKLRPSRYEKLKSEGAKRFATKLAVEMKALEDYLAGKIQRFKDSTKGKKLKKAKGKIHDAEFTFQNLGQGNYVYIPYLYKGELADVLCKCPSMES